MKTVTKGKNCRAAPEAEQANFHACIKIRTPVADLAERFYRTAFGRLAAALLQNAENTAIIGIYFCKKACYNNKRSEGAKPFDCGGNYADITHGRRSAR